MFANREDDRDPWARAVLSSFEPYSKVSGVFQTKIAPASDSHHTHSSEAKYTATVYPSVQHAPAHQCHARRAVDAVQSGD